MQIHFCFTRCAWRFNRLSLDTEYEKKSRRRRKRKKFASKFNTSQKAREPLSCIGTPLFLSVLARSYCVNKAESERLTSPQHTVVRKARASAWRGRMGATERVPDVVWLPVLALPLLSGAASLCLGALWANDSNYVCGLLSAYLRDVILSRLPSGDPSFPYRVNGKVKRRQAGVPVAEWSDYARCSHVLFSLAFHLSVWTFICIVYYYLLIIIKLIASCVRVQK